MIGAQTHPLKSYRDKNGISLSELASRVETSRQSLFRIEKGDQVPSLDLVSRILKHTEGLTADDFLPSQDAAE